MTKLGFAATVVFLLAVTAGHNDGGAVSPRSALEQIPASAHANAPPSSSASPASASQLKPTDEQEKDLRIAQLEARLAFRDLESAQRAYQEKLKALLDAADKVKRENKWDARTEFDASTLTFTLPARKDTDAPPKK